MSKVVEGRVIAARLGQEQFNKLDRIIRATSTGMVEVSYQLIFETLFDAMPESEMIELVRPVALEIDRRRGEARRRKQRITQLRHRIRKFEQEGKPQEKIAALQTELADLERQRKEARDDE